jgi:hypothetical protein
MMPLEPMIPGVVHSVWLGADPLPQIYVSSEREGKRRH